MFVYRGKSYLGVSGETRAIQMVIRHQHRACPVSDVSSHSSSLAWKELISDGHMVHPYFIQISAQTSSLQRVLS